jgi:hypothetical protein
MDLDNVVVIVYWMDGPEIIYRWGKIFRIRPDWPWGLM